ncbi:7TM diverse intracellular signaling domain-containing protein [Lamprobacter modestohalophilus]|uniref:hybrid sensor histidine kinase/response regulator n=1 Tax=Lamprobacter modestohalophilus TaxID=1064514 RepID=UPI002ADEEF08|nr:7TM diverse intracellular signaling domain-containing protein [Lamprobacter modestohalophilus]MEA1050573.1 7TM diverse intracellular signaling domain-containing protein [Lamprobacter modestohalophilus]
MHQGSFISRTFLSSFGHVSVVILLFLLDALMPAALAGDLVIDAEEQLVLGPHYQYLEDPNGELELEAVIGSERFLAKDLGKDPNLGYDTSVWWVKVPLVSRQGGKRLLELPFPTLDEVRVYLVDQASGVLLYQAVAGDLRPFAERPSVHRNFVFPLQLPAGQPVDLYLRAENQGSLTLGTLLWQPEAFQVATAKSNLALGLYFGILLALLAYNGLLYLSLRDPLYLWYLLFVASMALGQGAWTGLFFAELWPQWPAWGNLATVIGFNLTGLFGAIFSRTFLDTRCYAPWADRILLLWAVIFGALAIVAPWSPHQFNAMATSVAGLLFPAFAVGAGVQGWRNGVVSSRFFLLAWTILLVGTALLGARNLGLVPTSFLTRYAMQIGSALEMLLLSFALAERITELRRLAAQAAEARAETETKSRFLAHMSHEVRTPMTGILGMAQLVLRSPLQAQQRKYVQMIETSAESLLGILNDILDFSKMEAGKLQLERAPFDLRRLIERVMQLVEVAAQEKAIALVVDYPDEVARMYLGDSLRLTQVLTNLLSNAVKFTPAGEVRLRVRQPAPGRLRFEVQDTGIGMTSEEQGRLFAAFSQADTSTTRRFGGSGLGLAISQQLVTLMGGQIEVSSEAGRGSCFSVDIEAAVVLAEAGDEGLGDGSSGDRGLGDKGVGDKGVGDKGVGEDSCDKAARDEAKPDDGRREEADAKEADPDLSPWARQSPSSPQLQPNDQGDAPPPTDGFREIHVKPKAGEQPLLLAGRRLLLVEDNFINRELVLGFLRNTGLLIETAENGQQAVDKYAAKRFELILMDVQMPIMDGYEATQRIRGIDAKVPIIALTANAFPEDVAKSQAAGMTDHLSKPISAQVLRSLIERHLRMADEEAAVDARQAAASAPSATRTASDVPELPELAGLQSLDVDAALDLMGGNVALYESVLKQFLTEYADFNLDEKDPRTRQQLHVLKGLSGHLGAKRLQVLATALYRQDEANLHAVFNQEMLKLREEIDAFIRRQ